MATLRVPVTAADHALGPADAPVTVVEYGDYECPYCGEAVSFVQQVRDTFGDRVRFVFRNFPLQDAHPHAVDAAYVAEYAGSTVSSGPHTICCTRTRMPWAMISTNRSLSGSACRLTGSRRRLPLTATTPASKRTKKAACAAVSTARRPSS